MLPFDRKAARIRRLLTGLAPIPHPAAERLPEDTPVRRSAIVAAMFVVAVTVGLASVLPAGPARAGTFVAITPGVVGTIIWMASGSGLLAAISWALPLTGLLLAAEYVLPDPFGVVIQAGALGWYLAMMVWTPAVDWWYTHVLRREPTANPLRSR